MSEYVVPEGGLKAAERYLDQSGIQTVRPSPNYAQGVLEAFIRWLSENPIVPTFAQCQEMWRVAETKEDGTGTIHVIAEWQRRMFLAPEPPLHPVLKNWLDDAEVKGVDNATKVNYIRLFERAFQAGREAAK